MSILPSGSQSFLLIFFRASFLLAHYQLQALATSGISGPRPNAPLGTSPTEHTPIQPSVLSSAMAGQAPPISVSVPTAPSQGSHVSDYSSVTPGLIPPMHLNGALLHADFSPLIQHFNSLIANNSPLAAEPARQESMTLAREDTAADQRQGYGGPSRNQRVRNSIVNTQPYSPPLTRYAAGNKGRVKKRVTAVVKKSRKVKQPVPAVKRYMLCLLPIVVSTDYLFFPS